MGFRRLPLLLPMLGAFALFAASEVGAQARRGPADDPTPPGSRGENFSAGRPPAQLFQSDCTGAGCHSSPRGLVKNYSSMGLAGFLREHYTNSRESASALAAYLMSAGGGPADRSGRPQPPGSVPQQSQQRPAPGPAPRSAARTDEPTTELLRPEPGRPGAAPQAAPATPAGRPPPANRRGRPGAEQSEAAAPPPPPAAASPPAAAPAAAAPAASPPPPPPARQPAPPPPRQFDIFD